MGLNVLCSIFVCFFCLYFYVVIFDLMMKNAYIDFTRLFNNKIRMIMFVNVCVCVLVCFLSFFVCEWMNECVFKYDLIEPEIRFIWFFFMKF